MRVMLTAALCLVPCLSLTGQAPAAPDYRPGLTLQLGVANLDRSIRFYEDVLGFKLTERRDDLKFAHVDTNVPGLELGLSEVPQPAPSATIIANISVGNVAASRSLLESRGVSFPRPTQVIPGKVALAEFADPDGHRLRLAGPPPGASAPAAAADPDPLIESLRRQQDIVGSMMVRAAEKVSEEDYPFRPTKEVRSLVELFMHAASAQNYVCGVVAGKPVPSPEYLRTFGKAGFKTGEKSQVVETLRASFASCGQVLSALTPDRARTLVAPGFLERVMGPGQAPVTAFITVNVAHMNEHYGNVVTYLRLRGIVPPSSEK